jgi:hypothetical protein
MLAVNSEEVEEKIVNAYHKAAIIEGLARSPKRGPRKDVLVRNLTRSLANDVDTLAYIILSTEGAA